MNGTHRALVTGFGPFGHHPVNPSELIARAVAGRSAGGFQIDALTFPTSWFTAWEQLRSAVLSVQPRAVLLLGVSDDGRFRVERYANNRMRIHGDCDGRVPDYAATRGRVRIDGPEGLAGTFPFDPFLHALAQSTGAPPN